MTRTVSCAYKACSRWPIKYWRDVWVGGLQVWASIVQPRSTLTGLATVRSGSTTLGRQLSQTGTATVQQRGCSFPCIGIVPGSSAGIIQALAGPASPCHLEWVATLMYRHVFSYAE
jgi:hypothetical protein